MRMTRILAQQKPRRQLDDDLFSSTMIFSTSSRTSFARSPGEHTSLLPYGRRLSSFRTWSLGMPAAPKPLDKLAAGQRVADPDHGLSISWRQPPAFAIRSSIGDQCSGDVVAIASALLEACDGVSRSPASTSRPARSSLGGVSPAPMVAVLAASWSRTWTSSHRHSGPLLTGVEFTLVAMCRCCKSVREQCVKMTAREGFAAALVPFVVVLHFVRSPRRSAASLTRRTQPSSR